MSKIIKAFSLFFILGLLYASSVFAQLIPSVQPPPTPTQPPRLTLSKTLYMPWENISFGYEGEAQPLEVSLKSAGGEPIPYQAVLRKRDDNYVLDVEFSKKIKPGKYHITAAKDGKILTDNDIFIGMFLVQRDRFRYKQGEVVVSKIVVFDERGNIPCQEAPNLTIINKVTQEQEQNQTTKNAECQGDNPTFYESVFQSKNIGEYELALPNGQKDTFDVVNSFPVEVKKEAPVIVKRGNEYEVKITLSAQEDFEGNLTDTIPSRFELVGTGSAEMKNPNAVTENESTLNLSFPFLGEIPASLKFGEQPDDPNLSAVYQSVGLKSHDGVDFVMPINTSVLAVDDGEIVEIPSDLPSYGTTVVVKHSWGRSFYGHLNDKKVEVGQRIERGQVIGLSGNTGLSTAPHLHFSIDLENSDRGNGFLGKVDPIGFLSTRNNFAVSKKQLTWNISLKSGESVTAGYRFKVPDDGYFIHTEGPMKIVKKDNTTIYEERSPWSFVILP